MRITYDAKADALYIAFGEGPATVQEVAEGIARRPRVGGAKGKYPPPPTGFLGASERA